MAEPGDGRAQPPNLQRRKLLLAAGFVGANVVVLNKLGRGQTDRPRHGRPCASRWSANARISAPPSLAGAAPAPPAEHVFDRVISSGRVIDPETGYDAGRQRRHRRRPHHLDQHRAADRHAPPSTPPDLVVAPGFIDVLSYEPNSYGVWYKVGDGVTTNLGMHGINSTADEFFDDLRQRMRNARPCTTAARSTTRTCAASVEKLPSKAATSAQIERAASSRSRRPSPTATSDSTSSPSTRPWVTTDEITALATVAAEHGMPVFSHIRVLEPRRTRRGQPRRARRAVAGRGRRPGAAVHVDHITSMTTHVMGQAIEKHRRGPRPGHRRDRVPVPLRLLGHHAGVGAIRRRMAGALRHRLRRPRGRRHRRTAHRSRRFAALPGAEQARGRARHPRRATCRRPCVRRGS